MADAIDTINPMDMPAAETPGLELGLMGWVLTLAGLALGLWALFMNTAVGDVTNLALQQHQSMLGLAAAAVFVAGVILKSASSIVGAISKRPR